MKIEVNGLERELFTAHHDRSDVKIINQLVRESFFLSRSEFIRTAVLLGMFDVVTGRVNVDEIDPPLPPYVRTPRRMVSALIPGKITEMVHAHVDAEEFKSRSAFMRWCVKRLIKRFREFLKDFNAIKEVLAAEAERRAGFMRDDLRTLRRDQLEALENEPWIERHVKKR